MGNKADMMPGFSAFGPGRDLFSSTIIPHPNGGIHLGQYEWTALDIKTFQEAAGMSVSHYHSGRGNWALGYVSGHPHLDVSAASAAWNAGKVIVVQSYNLYAGTDDEHPSGFTVDQLLAGAYDSNLATFAAELRSFGKPCWMQCGREPNGVGQDYMGGWGSDGTQTTSWAITNENGYSQFTPPAVPSGAPADLYSGCSGATMPDGVGRLKAGQRYLYDYFVRREGLTFLTFDTQGFNVRYYKDPSNNQDLSDANDYAGHEAYALTLLQRCSDPAYWYPGDAYCHWVSLTLYLLDYRQSDWSWMRNGDPSGWIPDILIPNADWLTSLDRMMTQIAGVTSRPVLLAEFGCPDGMNSNTVYGASKVTDAFNAILDTYPQIGAVSMWSNHSSWFVADYFPYDCLITPGSLQATALRNVIAAHPGKVHAAVYFTGNQRHPKAQAG